MVVYLESKIVQVGDMCWLYYEGGEGFMLVLLYGYDFSKEVWLEVVKEFMLYFYLIILDLFGWGDFLCNDGVSYDIDVQVVCFDVFVQVLGLCSVIVVGYLMGGVIVGVYVVDYLQVVNWLVLMDFFGLILKENDFVCCLFVGSNFFIYDDCVGFQKVELFVFEIVLDLFGCFIDVLIQCNQCDCVFFNKIFNELCQFL